MLQIPSSDAEDIEQGYQSGLTLRDIARVAFDMSSKTRTERFRYNSGTPGISRKTLRKVVSCVATKYFFSFFSPMKRVIASLGLGTALSLLYEKVEFLMIWKDLAK